MTHATKGREFASMAFELKELKEITDDTGTYGWFEGYGSTFGNLDSDGDIIQPGAFADTIASGRKVKMLWQHGFKDVIGSFPHLMEDGKGLWVKGRINLGTEKGREAYALLKAGDLDSMSIGYSVEAKEYRGNVRLLQKLTLFEISIVTEPANAQATIAQVKSAKSFNSLAQVEADLKSHGYNPRAAKRLISAVKQFAGPRESANSDTAGDMAQRDVAQDVPVQAGGSPQRDVAETPPVDLCAIASAIKDLTHSIKGMQ